MNHPNPEDLVAYLYGELLPAARQRLAEHLTACPDCQKTVNDWRQTLSALDTWQVPVHRPALSALRTNLRWAATALILVGLGLWAGRVTAPGAPDARLMRAELLPVLRQELRQDLERASARTLAEANAETQRLVGEVVQTWSATREEDRQTTLALYNRAERQRKTDLAWLRRDLETVALTADARLETTQHELGQLASYSQTRAETR